MGKKSADSSMPRGSVKPTCTKGLGDPLLPTIVNAVFISLCFVSVPLLSWLTQLSKSSSLNQSNSPAL